MSKVYNNMIMSNDDKVCPRCIGKMWEHDSKMVECLTCGLWGWLPKKRRINGFDTTGHGLVNYSSCRKTIFQISGGKENV